MNAPETLIGNGPERIVFIRADRFTRSKARYFAHHDFELFDEHGIFPEDYKVRKVWMRVDPEEYEYEPGDLWSTCDPAEDAVEYWKVECK